MQETTALTVTKVNAADTLAVKVSNTSQGSVATGSAVPTGAGVTNPYASGADISGVDTTNNKYIQVYELDANSQVVAYNQITLTASQIAAPDAPVITSSGYINSNNSTTYPVSGTGLAGATVNVKLTDGVNNKVAAVMVDATGSWSTTVDASSLTDGSVTIGATQTDWNSNTSGSANSVSVTKDTVAPAIATVQAVNKTGGVADTIEAGDQIILTFSEAIDPASINTSLTPGGAAVTGVAATATGGVALDANADVTVANIITFNAGASATATSFTTDLALSSDGKTLTITLNTGTSQAITTPVNIDTFSAITTTVKDVAGNTITAGTPAAGASVRF